MEKEFLDFIAEIFDCNPKELSLDTTPDDVELWDSLMQLRLVGEISEKYDVEIPISEVADIKSLREFYNYIIK